MSKEVEVSDSLVLGTSPREGTVTLKWADALRQIIASFCAYSIVIQGGVNLAYSAVLLPQLTAADSDLLVNTAEASWIASLVAVSTPVGALIVGPLMNKFGRKKIVLVTCLPFILSWILVATVGNVTQLYVARIFAGVGAGLSTSSLVYASEICHTAFRPMILNCNSIAISLGILLTCTVGVLCAWRTLAWINFVMSVLSFIAIIPIPESPHWLVTFNKDESLSLAKISKSLHWLYTNSEVYEQQYTELISNSDKRTLDSSTENIFQIYSKPSVYKPIIIILILFVFQQCSGSYVFIFYAVDIFRKLGGEYSSALNEHVAMVLLGAIRVVMAIICSILSKNCDRKLLMYISATGMAVSTFVIALHAALIDSNDCKTGNGLLPALCFLSYILFCSLGYLVIPWGLAGELLPVKVRATMGGVMVMWAYLCMFFIVKSFPSLIESLEVHTIFAFFSAVSFSSIFYIFFFLPKTFGKRFIEIEEYFSNNKGCIS